MTNIITEIMGSTYLVKEATAANAVSEKARVKMDYKDKVGRAVQLQKIKHINEIKAQENHSEDTVYVKTEIVVNEKGEHSVVLITNNQGYREINLNGGVQEKIINPVKAKKAYFKN